MSDLSPLFTWRSAIAESGLEPTTRLVAFALSLHMNERGGSCYPSVATLARETGLAKSTVNTHLNVLIAGGWLERELGGGNKSNRYTARSPLREPEGSSETALREPDSTPPGAGDEGVIEDVNRTTSLRSVASLGEVISDVNTQELVGEYVDLSRSRGAEPPRRYIGQLAQQIKPLLEEGQRPEAIRDGLRILVDRALGPSLLPSCVQQAQLEAGGAGGPRQRGVSADDILRGRTA